MKVLQTAQRALAEAEHKVAAVKKFIPLMQKQTQAYRGGVQRFASTVQIDLPVAVEKLDRMLAALEAYVSLGSGGPPELASSTADGSRGAGMTRPADAAATSPPPSLPEIPANFPRLEPPQVALTHVEHLTGEPRT